jgi:hypothetical protein
LRRGLFSSALRAERLVFHLHVAHPSAYNCCQSHGDRIGGGCAAIVSEGAVVVKGFTARQANRLLGRIGEPFWQKESYDRWVRSETEWDRIASHIEENPVQAGLAARAENYPWSSAHAQWREGVDRSVDAARVGACATTPRCAEP